MIQIRRSVFETNSSSVHTISITKENTIPEPGILIFNGNGEFGWEFELYDDSDSKADYLWQGITTLCPESLDRKLSYQLNITREKAIQFITDTLAEYGIKAVFPYNNVIEKQSPYDPEYTYRIFTNMNKERDHGYVDHADQLNEFVQAVLTNKEQLINYLFNSHSFVSTGNDNEEDNPEFIDYGPSWEYTKWN